MIVRALGSSALRVSAIGVRCGADTTATPGGARHNEGELIAAVHAALDRGINYFESAAGADSERIEEILGRALVGRSDGAIVAAVCRAAVPVTRVAALRGWLEATLRRLRRDRLEACFVRWPDVSLSAAELVEFFSQALQRGEVGAVGVEGFGCEQLATIRRMGPVHAVRSGLNVLENGDCGDLIPYCQEHRLAVLAVDPLADGLLSEATRGADEAVKSAVKFGARRRRADLAAAERVAAVAQRGGQTAAELALAWVAQQPGVTVTVGPAARPSQVASLAGSPERAIGEATGRELVDILSERDRELDRS